VYLFVASHIEEQFDDCYALWRRCLDIERPAIQAAVAEEEKSGYVWWPHFDNDDVLLKVADHRGAEQFVRDLVFLLDYPPGVCICKGLDVLVDRLGSFSEPRELIDQAFQKIIERDPEYIVQYDEWVTSE
jgi:hypothetical protein